MADRQALADALAALDLANDKGSRSWVYTFSDFGQDVEPIIRALLAADPEPQPDSCERVEDAWWDPIGGYVVIVQYRGKQPDPGDDWQPLYRRVPNSNGGQP